MQLFGLHGKDICIGQIYHFFCAEFLEQS